MSLLSIGMSGLNAAQGSLSVLSNNIANANTSGYSRQQTTPNASANNPYGGVYIGSGNTLADVRRVYNEFLDAAYQNSTALNNDAKAYSSQASAIASAVRRAARRRASKSCGLAGACGISG